MTDDETVIRMIRDNLGARPRVIIRPRHDGIKHVHDDISNLVNGRGVALLVLM